MQAKTAVQAQRIQKNAAGARGLFVPRACGIYNVAYPQ